ncbi:MAG: DHH family phosphoesterase [Candidatus Micrarchaeota archaeon]
MPTILKRFIGSLSPKSRILLLCHSNADLDSVGTALGLFFSLPKKNRYVVGVFGHPNQTAGKLAEKLGVSLIVNPVLDSFDAIICCDFNAPNRLHDSQDQLKKFKKPVLLIDHHPKTIGSLKTPFSVLDPKVQSASQLAFDLLLESKFPVSKKSLIAFACGMVSDSADLSIANAKLIKQLGTCLEQTGLSVGDLHQLTAVNEPVSERLAKLKSLQRVQVLQVASFLIAFSNVDFFESQSANALIAAGSDVALVAGVDAKTKFTRLSVRSSHSVVQKAGFHAGKQVCVPLAGFFDGFGNGHAGAAGFSCQNAGPQQVLQKAVELAAVFLEKSENKNQNSKKEVKRKSMHW